MYRCRVCGAEDEHSVVDCQFCKAKNSMVPAAFHPNAPKRTPPEQGDAAEAHCYREALKVAKSLGYETLTDVFIALGRVP